ncbi:uncharacterized protein LOC120172756 [Hibiscus syriacus]|uniref:uncharacterized protein LOC120172756 n=1 Tax=Hibiscus syriacus TaxID=106335 RepID=UPI0019232C3B|nr:uncharacterized protein LOC120172756 [Hibiscus syriacus]
MDSITAAKSRLEFAKVCVEIVVKDTIPKHIEVILKDGQTTSISVEVPWLPQSCRRCNVFGHNEKGCLLKVNTNPTVSQVWKKKGEIIPNSAAIHVGGIEALQEPEKTKNHATTITEANNQKTTDSFAAYRQVNVAGSDTNVLSKEVDVHCSINAPVRIDNLNSSNEAANKQKDDDTDVVSLQAVVAASDLLIVQPIKIDEIDKAQPTMLKRSRGRPENAKSQFLGLTNRFDILNSAEEIPNCLESLQRKPRVASLGVANLVKELKSKKKEQIDRAKGLKVGGQGGPLGSPSQ